MLTFAPAIRATAFVLIRDKPEFLFFLFEIKLVIYAFVFFKVFFLKKDGLGSAGKGREDTYSIAFYKILDIFFETQDPVSG